MEICVMLFKNCKLLLKMSYQTANVFQLLSQLEELHVKLNILIAKIFNSRKSSPYESHRLVDTFMKYVLSLEITTYKVELKN